MKFYSIAALASIAVPALAQLQGIPSCAVNCALGALPSSCGTNFTCVCQATAFIVGLEPCVQTACSPADQSSALVGAESLCAGYGVSLSIAVPTSPPAAATTAPPAAVTPPPTTTKASNVTTNTSGPMSVFTGAAQKTDFYVSGAFLAGAGFLLALF